MKSLLYVIKTLLEINGAIALLLLVCFAALRQQKTTITANVSGPDQSFHRDIQELPSDYEKQIEANRRQIEKLKQEKEQQINALKAQLAAYQQVAPLPAVVSHSQPSPTSPGKVNEPSTPKSESSSTLKPVKVKKATAVVDTKPPVTPQTQESSPASEPDKTSHRQESNNSEDKVPLSAEIAQEHENKETPTLAVTPSQQAESDISPDRVNTIPLYDSSEFLSALPRPGQLRPSSSPIVAPKATTPLDPSIRLANDLAAGLIVAQKKNEIKYRTTNYRKVQTAIKSLRKGSSDNLEQAASRAQIDSSMLARVAEWGKERPGRFDPHHISMVNPE